MPHSAPSEGDDEHPLGFFIGLRNGLIGLAGLGLAIGLIVTFA